MSVGAAEDVAKQQDYDYAKAQMDKAKLAGLDTIRVTQTWTRNQKAVGPMDTIELGNVVNAAQFTGIRVILSLYPFGSSVTPLADQDRANFAAFCVDVAKKVPVREGLHRRQRAEPEPLLDAAVRSRRRGRRRAGLCLAPGDGIRRPEGRAAAITIY